MHRWGAIQEAVNKFSGCLSRIESRNQSGVNYGDKLAQARMLYKVEEKKSFTFMNCYDLLKHQPKWMDKLVQLATQKTSNKKLKSTDNASPAISTPAFTEGNNADDIEAVNPSAVTNAMGRPLGGRRKKSSGNNLINPKSSHWTICGVKRKRLMQRRRRKMRGTKRHSHSKKTELH